MRILYCEICGEPIPAKKVLKGGLKRPPRTCTREHSIELLKQEGHYVRLSALGNAAQKQHKQETGHIPNYEHRAAVVAQINHEQPRRRRKGQ